MRIDHRNHSLSFGTDLGVAQKEDVPEGPYIQRMPSEQIRVQLTQLAQTLHKAVRTLQSRDQEVCILDSVCLFLCILIGFPIQINFNKDGIVI